MKKKKIKEERVNIDDIIDDRVATFWKEMDGIIDFLNKSNKKIIIQHYNSPIITNYILWRMLNELKILNIQQKQVEV